MILKPQLSIGLHVPAFSPQPLPAAAQYANFFRRSEALGFDALWVEDRILHNTPLLDPLMLLTWAAANTNTMLLGTAVLALNLRRAAVLARQLATLQHLCEGRLVLGVSVGGQPKEYAAVGVPMGRRVSVFRDSLHVLRELLSGAPLTHASDIAGLPASRYEDAIVRPAAEIPVLLGGIVDAAVRRAGSLADGWIMAPFGSLDDFRRRWQLVRDAASAAGRDPHSLVAGRLLYVCADSKRARARDRLKAFLNVYYGDLIDVDRDAIFGPPAEVAERLSEQVQAGITHLMLGVPTLDPEQIECLAAEVMPVLRAAAPVN